jgi:hypothetical protein
MVNNKTNQYIMTDTIDKSDYYYNIFVKCDICDNIKSIHNIDRHYQTKKHIANMQLATEEEKEKYKIKRRKMYDAIKKYKDRNREDINKKQREYFKNVPKITCEICNCKIGKYGVVAHQRSKKHIKNLEKQNGNVYVKKENQNENWKYIDFENKIDENKGYNFKIYCQCCDTYFMRRNINVHLSTTKHKKKRDLRDVELSLKK